MLVKIEGHTVPHFKDPVYAKMELWGLECGGTFSIQISLLNISHLLHKIGFVKTESVATVDVDYVIGQILVSMQDGAVLHSQRCCSNIRILQVAQPGFVRTPKNASKANHFIHFREDLFSCLATRTPNTFC